MPVTKKTYTQKITYWDCGTDKGHRHQTKETATDCFYKEKNRKPKRQKVDDFDRNKKIAIDVFNGKTFEEVGKSNKVGKERIRVIFWRIFRPIHKRTWDFSDAPCVPHQCTLKELRVHKDYWIDRISNISEEDYCRYF